MYQDSIETEAKSLITNASDGYKHSNVFSREKLKPLDFVLEAEGDDAAHIARDILSKRTNDEILIMSIGIDSMLQIGENLLTTISLQQLSESPTRKEVTFTQGRALYLLSDYFDLTTIAVKKAQWCEMFATLTLMQSAEISGARHKSYGDDDMSQAMKLYSEQFILDMTKETLDSIARAECLFDKKQKSVITGSKGGTSKGKRIEPLKDEVIRLYLAKYTSRSNRHASKLIEAELIELGSPLLALSSSEEKQMEFGKWIGKFKNGQLKLSIN